MRGEKEGGDCDVCQREGRAPKPPKVSQTPQNLKRRRLNGLLTDFFDIIGAQFNGYRVDSRLLTSYPNPTKGGKRLSLPLENHVPGVPKK